MLRALNARLREVFTLAYTEKVEQVADLSNSLGRSATCPTIPCSQTKTPALGQTQVCEKESRALLAVSATTRVSVTHAVPGTSVTSPGSPSCLARDIPSLFCSSPDTHCEWIKEAVRKRARFVPVWFISQNPRISILILILQRILSHRFDKATRIRVRISYKSAFERSRFAQSAALPTRITRTSITLVCVSPVTSRSPVG